MCGAVGYSAIRAGVEVDVVTLGILSNPTRMYTRHGTLKMVHISPVTCSGSLRGVEAGTYTDGMRRRVGVFGLLFDGVSEGEEIKCA